MIILVIVFVMIVYFIVKFQRNKLMLEISRELNISNIDNNIVPIDDQVTVKSQQALNNYDDIKYFKTNDELFKKALFISDNRKQTRQRIYTFLGNNSYTTNRHYSYVSKKLNNYAQQLDGYKVLIKYITSAGNNKGQKIMYISSMRFDELNLHPEYLMSKTEYNKYIKAQNKKELEEKKHNLYERVNIIIDNANRAKDVLIVKSGINSLDDSIQKLFESTINSIQKIKNIDSDEWGIIEEFITNIENQIRNIIKEDYKIREYYNSEEFNKIKETCTILIQSQKDFNEYINKKSKSITELFGTRVVRNNTENTDTYNYIRTYKKNITPFVAEVSSTVFGSAENNPLDYVIKYFYPNKNQYGEQIVKLKTLIEELETLKEAKDIIDNYKKDYNQYIKDVPTYIIEKDEDGFYHRLGLAIIDEEVLNVEYKFSYTSEGGMAQRSFTIPMNEENITELINRLESKLSLQSQIKEQRALMTSKLRKHIKERDNYTCCQCGNSIYTEPNLLLEIDHIIPVSKGGLTIEDNLQTLCWKCNRNKGAKITE